MFVVDVDVLVNVRKRMWWWLGKIKKSEGGKGKKRKGRYEILTRLGMMNEI